MLFTNNDEYVSQMPIDFTKFSNYLLQMKNKDVEVGIEGVTLVGKAGITSSIQYSRDLINILGDNLSYTFTLNQQKIELSLQFYENTRNHYRLFGFTKCNGGVGLVFSINMSLQKQADGTYSLANKLMFSDRIEGDAEIAKMIRKRKQEAALDYLEKKDFKITDKNEVEFGIFDPHAPDIDQAFIGTSAEKFIKDYIFVTLVKGHYMGNKGYRLGFLPTLN